MKQILLKKMRTELFDPINYFIGEEKDEVFLNNFLGNNLKIQFTNEIYCLKCNKKLNKIFAQGYCYNCFISSPETDACIINPEKCKAHEGISRDMEFAKEVCLKSHYVYFAKTSTIKVGVTRATQIPTRWIDQGATETIKFAKTPYRQLAGEIEVAMKQFFADKTSWQKMLKNVSTTDSLLDTKKLAINLLPDHLKKYVVANNEIWKLKYPILKNPIKIKSLKLDKTPQIQGILTGIKGQYLIFDNEYVFNIRSHSGYVVEIS